MNTHACECEHVAHFEKDKRTPNGNPGHNYGVRFVESQLVRVKTAWGTFKCCPDCDKDCMVSVKEGA